MVTRSSSTKVSSAFAARLRRHRIEAGLTQAALAERAGLSPRTIQHLEAGAGRPFPESTLRLADALDLTADVRAEFLEAARPARWEHQVLSQAESVPPSRSSPPRNLPRQLTSFVGRQREVAEIDRLLGSPEVRLLTLMGAGGVGKTRLSLQVATDLQAFFADEVFFVSLAALAEGAQVMPAIAQVVGVRETPGRPLLDTLIDHLQGRSTLLVLDNFEQVIEAAPAVGEVLGACPDLKVLITSRIGLRIYGEREYPVEPLAVPAPGIQDLETLAGYDAIRLFVDRAEAVKPGFALNPDNAAVIAAICQRLDGLPLALELAAARVRVLAPSALLTRLEQTLSTLTGGPRDAPTRQQTLRATLAWSHELLSPAEQVLFRRLAVFAGGFSFEAAEAVVGELKLGLLEGLDALIGKSLLFQEPVSGNTRFGMLQTLREFALEKLVESGEEPATRHAHARYYLNWLSGGEPVTFARIPVLSRYFSSWDEIELERANLREALRWCLRTGDLETGGWLVQKQFLFWANRGPVDEGRAWAEQFMAMHHASDSLAGIPARCTAGFLAYTQTDLPAARQRLETGLAMARAIGEAGAIGFCLDFLGRISVAEGDLERAQRCFAELLSISRAADEAIGIGMALEQLGWLSFRSGDHAKARAHWEESLQLGLPMPRVLHKLGHLALVDGDLFGAARFFQKAWDAADRQGAVGPKLEVLSGLAALALARKNSDLAARLLGARDCLLGQAGTAADVSTRLFYEETLDSVRATLDDAAFSRAWAEGRAMTLAEAFSSGETMLSEELRTSASTPTK